MWKSTLTIWVVETNCGRKTNVHVGCYLLGWKIRICEVKENFVLPNQCCYQTRSYSLHCRQFRKRRGQRAHNLQVLVDAVGVPVDGTGWRRLCGRSRSFGRRSGSFGCKLWRWRGSVYLFPSGLVVTVIAVDLALHHAVLAHHHHLRRSQGNAPAVQPVQRQMSGEKRSPFLLFLSVVIPHTCIKQN